MDRRAQLIANLAWAAQAFVHAHDEAKATFDILHDLGKVSDEDMEAIKSIGRNTVQILLTAQDEFGKAWTEPYNAASEAAVEP